MRDGERESGEKERGRESMRLVAWGGERGRAGERGRELEGESWREREHEREREREREREGGREREIESGRESGR